MVLSGNYTTRAGGFNYNRFVKDMLVKLEGDHTNKTLLYRSAVEHGACEASSDKIIKELSVALNTVGNQIGFKRFKIKGKTGYFFKSI